MFKTITEGWFRFACRLQAQLSSFLARLVKHLTKKGLKLFVIFNNLKIGLEIKKATEKIKKFSGNI